MKRIHRYEKCWIFTLFRFKRLQIELVYAPPNYQIAEHSHDNEDIELVLLFGHNIRFHRKLKKQMLGQSFFARWHHIGKVFSIPAGAEHWFEVSSCPLLFLNIERWHNAPTSVCQDLQLTSNKQEDKVYGKI